MEGITPALLLGALVYSFVNFLRYLSAKQWRPAVTQLIAWVSGVGAVFIFAATSLAGGVTVAGITLSSANLFDKILVGLLASSLLSTGAQVVKAIDNTQSAQVPQWGGDAPPQ